MAKRKQSEPSVDQEAEVRTGFCLSAFEPERSEVISEELVEATQTESHIAEPTPKEGECPLEPLTTPSPVSAADRDSGPFWDLLALAGYTCW